MEKQAHANKFINAAQLATHQKDFTDQNIVYLSIVKIGIGLVGYFILKVEKDRNNIEFRRILVDENQRQVGQTAIKQMDWYCESTLSAEQIWLDVYLDNERGKHIYKKPGHKQFKTENSSDRMLYFYEKGL